MKKKYILWSVVFLILIAPSFIFAQPPPPSTPPSSTYSLLAPFPGLMNTTFDIRAGGLSEYLQGIFRIAIGAAGILAVVMLVVCGIRMMGTGSSSAKSEAKECITNAILGLLLAIGSWVILNTINPDLVRADLPGADQTIPILSTPTPPVVGVAPPTEQGVWYFQVKDPRSGQARNLIFYNSAECATQYRYHKDLYDRDSNQLEPITECKQVAPVRQGEDDVRERLKQYNIFVNKKPCRSLDVKELDCTSVERLSNDAVETIAAIANAVGGNPSTCTQNTTYLREPMCKVVVTGGTEIDSHTILAGTSNHSVAHGGAGKTFDLAKTKPLIEYFRNSSAKVAPSFRQSSKSLNSEVYQRYYFEERGYWCTEELNHFHCCSETTSAWYCKGDSVLPGGRIGKLHCKESENGPKVCTPCDPAKNNVLECPKD